MKIYESCLSLKSTWTRNPWINIFNPGDRYWMMDRKKTIERIFGRKFSLATRVQLLWKGEDSFKSIFDAVRSAEEFICLQFYIFRNDETGSDVIRPIKTEEPGRGKGLSPA